MRTKEFLAELNQLGKSGWRAVKKKDGVLRARSQRKRKICHCPITAVATRKGWRLHGELTGEATHSAAEYIGLSAQNAQRIMYAADNRLSVGTTSYQALWRLRRKLFNALLPS